MENPKSTAASTSAHKRKISDDDDYGTPISPVAIGNASGAATDTAGSTSQETTYRLNFGKYRGKTLLEIPESYIYWLIDHGAYLNRLDLRAALLALGYLKVVEVDFNSNTVSKSLKIHNVVPAGPPYCLVLDAIPESYLNFLIDNDVPKWRPDLIPALRRGPVVHLERFLSRSFQLPDKRQARHKYFFDEWNANAPLWISKQDAMMYFKVVPSAMENAGLISFSSPRKKWWLYEVFKYAEHFGTICEDRQVSWRALSAFLEKHDRREREIVGRVFAG